MTHQEQVELLIEHLHSLVELQGEYATLMQSRSLVKYYITPPDQLAEYTCLDALITDLQKV